MLPTRPLQIRLDIVSADHPDDAGRDEVELHDLGPRRYRISMGRGFASAELDWDRPLLADLTSLRRAAIEPEIPQRLGARLRRFLRDTDWPRHEAELLAALERRTPVHVTLCADAGEIYALPWDLLVLDTSGQHLGELPDVLVRYAWLQSRASAAPATTPAGCILLAWSAAAGEVPAAAHIQALRSSWGQRSTTFNDRRDVLPRVSWGRLQDALRAAAERGCPVRVLHILCHGVPRGRNVCLAWNDDDGDDLAIIDGARLRQLLGQYATDLRLVILSACDSSNEGRLGTHLGSLARNLHRSGIQTVIGSAVPLSIRGSITFAEHFHRTLASQHTSPAGAFVAARQRLARHVRTHDWLALRFYAQPDDVADIPPLLPRNRNRPGRKLAWLLAAIGSTIAAVLAVTSIPKGGGTAIDASLAHDANTGPVTRDAGLTPYADARPAMPAPDGSNRPTRIRPGDTPNTSSTTHDVELLMPSFVSSPEILVDGQAAEILKTSSVAITVRVRSGWRRITVRAPPHAPCHQSVAIHGDGLRFSPCAP